MTHMSSMLSSPCYFTTIIFAFYVVYTGWINGQYGYHRSVQHYLYPCSDEKLTLYYPQAPSTPSKYLHYHASLQA